MRQIIDRCRHKTSNLAGLWRRQFVERFPTCRAPPVFFHPAKASAVCSVLPWRWQISFRLVLNGFDTLQHCRWPVWQAGGGKGGRRAFEWTQQNGLCQIIKKKRDNRFPFLSHLAKPDDGRIWRTNFVLWGNKLEKDLALKIANFKQELSNKNWSNVWWWTQELTSKRRFIWYEC